MGRVSFLRFHFPAVFVPDWVSDTALDREEARARRKSRTHPRTRVPALLRDGVDRVFHDGQSAFVGHSKDRAVLQRVDDAGVWLPDCDDARALRVVADADGYSGWDS